MPEVYKTRILKLLKHRDYLPMKLAQLAKASGVSEQDYPRFKLAFEQLRQAGGLVLGPKNLISLPALSGSMVGTFRANIKGFGFVIPLEPTAHGDLFIPANATASAMTGDIVATKTMKKGKRNGQIRYVGTITDILERAHNQFVGTLLKKPFGWIVQPDGKILTDPVSVDDVTAKNAKAKDKVVVEILSYPTEKDLARGVITKVLGKVGRYETEISSIIHQFHLPTQHDEDCLGQARKIASSFNPEQALNREDITDKVIITIDPPDAKDFDDAISLEKDSDGNWVLGVHIADVSFFLPPDSPMDKEAKTRGNSIYLPGRTIPMLPEILSNGICSLQPNQKRFVKSAYLTYDDKGNVLDRRFANSLICSTMRLTYQQADKILKGHTRQTSSEVIELLKNLEALAQKIEKRREKNGMLHLDLPETELIMDKAGRVIDARAADASYPHTIIEMFMVEANEAVASFLDRLNIPVMRRIHPDPDSLSLKNLSTLIRTLGFTLPRTPNRQALQDLLTAARGKDCSLAVNLVVLRSLEKAQYSPLHVGHFALASTHYCHFTSPIRRYADLLIHRALQSQLQKPATSDASDLTEIGKHISFTEQRAVDAERELKSVLILQMLSKRIGDELDCVVTGVTSFGVFAQSRKFGIEGLIQMTDLGSDIWQFDAKSHSIVGQRTGLSVHLGKAINCRIISVNVSARQLNLCPVKPLVDAKKQKTNSFPRPKRKPAKKSRKRR